MARKRMFSEDVKREIASKYIDGLSLAEVGAIYCISMTAVLSILKKQNVPRRTLAEGAALKWKNDKFKQNQIDKRTGKSSGALGKNWKIDKIIKKPNLTGSKNHRWKGGRTKLSQMIRSSAEYSFWRMSIFRRDNWTCQICGAKNKKGEKYIFDADHIYPFHKILDNNNITSMEEAISCKGLWDIDNGRTLCRECHKKTDTWGVNRKHI